MENGNEREGKTPWERQLLYFSLTMKFETAGYSRKFISTRRHSPEYSNVNFNRRENLSSCCLSLDCTNMTKQAATNHGYIAMFLRALTVSWNILSFVSVTAQQKFHPSSHFQPIYYTRLGWKRKETRSDGDMLQSVITNSQAVTAWNYNSRLPGDFSNAFTPREIHMHTRIYRSQSMMSWEGIFWGLIIRLAFRLLSISSETCTVIWRTIKSQ